MRAKVLVESKIEHEIFNQKLILSNFLKRNLSEDDCFATPCISKNR